MTPSTRGYAEGARELIERYESIPFEEKHRVVLHLIPSRPCRVLDIGAGSGVDAAWFAQRGHRVVAVEPVKALRLAAMALHPSPRIEWVDDHLPGLARMRGREETFDLVMLTAVWMHLDKRERQRAMPPLARLLATGGLLVMALRHGPRPSARRMFEVSPAETSRLAVARGLRPVLAVCTESAQPDNRQAGIIWSRLAFERVGETHQRPAG